MIEYSKTVRWTEKSGSVMELCVTFDSEEAAEENAFESAARWGWTPKRWWQWWRCGDTPNPTRWRTKPQKHKSTFEEMK